MFYETFYCIVLQDFASRDLTSLLWFHEKGLKYWLASQCL